MRVVTYATHDFGKFQGIVNNPFGVNVDVLGWGTKWTGFMDKIKAVHKYCLDLRDDEIVVFIDGFDSTIMRNLDGLEDAFKSFNCGVLLSRSNDNFHPYIIKKVFGTCKNNLIANSGLYMGTVFHLKIFLEDVLLEESSDDQRNFNSVCHLYDWVKVDEDDVIFFNKIVYKKYVPNKNIYFLSEPGSPNFKRYSRAIFEYGPFFKTEILVIILILFIWSIYKS